MSFPQNRKSKLSLEQRCRKFMISLVQKRKWFEMTHCILVTFTYFLRFSATLTFLIIDKANISKHSILNFHNLFDLIEKSMTNKKKYICKTFIIGQRKIKFIVFEFGCKIWCANRSKSIRKWVLTTFSKKFRNLCKIFFW